VVAFSRFARYFDEVARRNSIRGASERLHVAPSAIDRQLLQAEQELGVPLFERIPSGVRLTAAGEILVNGVRQWQRDYARLLSQIDDLKGLRRGNVNLAVVDSTIQDIVPDLIKDFQRKYPGITYNIRVAAADRIIQLVLEGDADVGLLFNPPYQAGLKIDFSVSFKMGVLLPRRHPLAKRSRLRLSDLTNVPVIIPDEDKTLRAVFDRALESKGIKLRSVVVASDTSLVRSLVARGVGAGIITKIGAAPEIKSGSLPFRNLEDTGIRPSVMCAVTASGRHLSVPATLLSQELISRMKDLGA
jgi:DNA-binding transcriptional LysR family regulator